ncbi:MAG: SH3 domain-containing protein [Chloroflexi bacterium]|nr:SH3 domain-containing protein [Chloroflexota bacterium]
MKIFRKISYFLMVLCFTTIAAQQAVCSVTVQQALAAVGQDCSAIGRNQACYGYVSLEATPREGAQNFTFTQKGDLVNVVDIDSLQLSRLDVANNTWGIALLKLQANIPDSLPGQNVTFMVFGDVQVTNASAPGADLPNLQVSTNSTLNIRSAPSTSGAIVGSFGAGQTTSANGRSADGSWLWIQLPNSDEFGWVFASLVKVSGDASTLTVIDPTAQETKYTPMQAFYFKTGITQTECSEAPEDGILIQTPKGVGQVNLRANDVDVQLGSTAFIQAQPSANMVVSVVEGEGHITAFGVTVDVPAGTQTTIPMDANLRASGPPTPAQPYDAALVEPLPISLLPEQITMVIPATAEATETPSAGGTGAVSGGIGPYTVQKIMDLGGEVPTGSICSLDQAFTIHQEAGGVAFDMHFTPASATQGKYAYGYSIPEAGETVSGEGSYSVSEAAADGSRTLTFDGTQINKFNGGNPTFHITYSVGLRPLTGNCVG